MKKTLSLAFAIVAASVLSSGAQWYVNGFDNLALPGGAGFIPNSSPSLTYSGMGITYSVAGLPGGDPLNPSVFSFQYPLPNGTDVAVGAVTPADRLHVQMLGGAVAGIKGDFWLTDSIGAPAAGTLGAAVTLSDSSVVGIPLNAPYYAPNGLTISEFDLFQISQLDNSFPTMDNFGVIAVPEPGVIATNALVIIGAVGSLVAYRRRKN